PGFSTLSPPHADDLIAGALFRHWRYQPVESTMPQNTTTMPKCSQAVIPGRSRCLLPLAWRMMPGNRKPGESNAELQSTLLDGYYPWLPEPCIGRADQAAAPIPNQHRYYWRRSTGPGRAEQSARPPIVRGDVQQGAL